MEVAVNVSGYKLRLEIYRASRNIVLNSALAAPSAFYMHFAYFTWRTEYGSIYFFRCRIEKCNLPNLPCVTVVIPTLDLQSFVKTLRDAGLMGRRALHALVEKEGLGGV